MRPDLGEQLEINAIDRFGILPEEIVNRRAIGGGADASLAPGARGKEKSDSSSEDSGAHESPSFYSYRSRDAVPRQYCFDCDRVFARVSWAMEVCKPQGLRASTREISVRYGDSFMHAHRHELKATRSRLATCTESGC